LKIPVEKNKISKEMFEILHKMLTVDPEKRIEWDVLLNYPLF